ncbi:MAG: coenzyme F420-0:L-glutamate ligase [Bacillota bacterium]
MDNNGSKNSTKDFSNIKIQQCIPVRTDLIRPNDSIIKTTEKYVKPQLRNGDIVVCSEKALAFSQGRVVPEDEVSVGILARTLSRFVIKSPYGIGMRDPRTMQVAINMAGPLRIILAAMAGGLGKLFGRSGYFYRVAGLEVSMIDGVVDHRFKELRKYIIPPPEDPDRAAFNISEALSGAPVVIMDVNDLGGSTVVGKSHDNLPIAEIEDFMRYDNPLGQGTQQTPVGILR